MRSPIDKTCFAKRWEFQGYDIISVPQDMVGFVYEITLKHDRKTYKYIGRKSFRDTDWMSYTSSGTMPRIFIKKFGDETMRKNILAFASSQEMLNDMECEWHDRRKCVQSDQYLNLVRGDWDLKTEDVTTKIKREMKKIRLLSAWRDTGVLNPVVATLVLDEGYAHVYYPSVKECAGDLKRSSSNISRIMSGERTPRDCTIRQIKPISAQDASHIQGLKYFAI